jgi:ubiquinone/menaquinone biosynthesis C-methylase UbiE
MWNHEFRATMLVLSVGLVLATGYELFRLFSAFKLSESLAINAILAWICLGGMIVLSVWALLHPFKKKSWAERPQTVALLQSPFTGQPLHVVSEHGREALVSSSGERFPIRNEIPAFLKPEDLTGDNLKYNHMYETIGGFYDDTQRVFCAMGGFDRDAFFLGHLRLLEVQPGDSVLETSVGTGLNFKYLPRGVKLSGLDLSPEMLVNCQANLRRWELDADLYLGNAESLPFADSSFDVVYHVGGINFFNDRGKAIREMIRVAKPGSLLLISDETEKHVKSVYEKQPGGLYRNRKEPVSAPINLLPPEMQEIHLEELMNGNAYALTFRKPAAVR